MKTFEEYIQPLDEAAGLAPNEWLADMERSWRMHYVRLNNKVEALAKESLDKGQFKDFKKAQGEFSSAVSTFQYLFDIMAEYNKGHK
jgi:enterochelin esterase-like enzyme